MAERAVTVRVIYKSGVIQDFDCVSFKAECNGIDGSLRRIKWVDALPRPLFLGIDNVAAIYDLTAVSSP